MSTTLKYIAGAVLLVVGLTIKTCLNHHMDYWSLVRGFSILCFGIGLVLLLPEKMELILGSSSRKKKPSSNQPIKTLKRIAIYLALFFALLGLEEMGTILNYNLRAYYLGQETAVTTGYAKGVKRIDLSRIGSEDFYLVDFDIDGNRQSMGLLLSYAAKDSGLLQELPSANYSRNPLMINNYRSGKLTIRYSKKFPSFFKISD